MNNPRETRKSQEVWEKMKRQHWRATGEYEGGGLNSKSKRQKREENNSNLKEIQGSRQKTIIHFCVTFITLKDNEDKEINETLGN